MAYPALAVSHSPYNNSAPKKAQALNAYQNLELSSRIEMASPIHLVILLYEEIIQSLKVLKYAQDAQLSHKANAEISRSKMILVSLIGSLDLQDGGELAVTLHGIYRASLAKLVKITNQSDSRSCDDLIDGFENLLVSWRSIEK